MAAFFHTNRNSLFSAIQSFDVTYSKALTASLNKQVREKSYRIIPLKLETNWRTESCVVTLHNTLHNTTQSCEAKRM